jgi:hypothetical protein
LHSQVFFQPVKLFHGFLGAHGFQGIINHLFFNGPATHSAFNGTIGRHQHFGTHLTGGGTIRCGNNAQGGRFMPGKESGDLGVEGHGAGFFIQIYDFLG